MVFCLGAYAFNASTYTYMRSKTWTEKKKAIQLVKRHCEIVFTSAIPIYPENFLSLERGALYHSPNIPTDGWLVKVVIPTDNQSV